MDIEYRDWDSRFFGYPVGSIRFSSLSALEMQLRQARQQAQALGLRLLYIETPPLNSHQRKIFQEAKANLVAINVEFINRVSRSSIIFIVHASYTPTIRCGDIECPMWRNQKSARDIELVFRTKRR